MILSFFDAFLKVFDKHIATHLNIDSELLWIYIQLRRQYEALIALLPFHPVNLIAYKWSANRLSF